MRSAIYPLMAGAILFWALPAGAQQGTTMMQDGSTHPMMGAGLVLPRMDPERGRKLFASKGCVVCHSINGVGGEDAPMLDAEFMDTPMNPFDFTARMWRGAPAMIAMQEDELGGQIEFTGDELASIIAFVHDADEQARFSKDDIPVMIARMMHHMNEENHHKEGMADDHG